MCIFALNNEVACMNYQSNSSPDYKKAVTELLSIEGREIGDNCQKNIKWINKHANNKAFQSNAKAKFLKGMLIEPVIFKSSQALEKELKKMPDISYLTRNSELQYEDFYCVDLWDLSCAKIEMQIISHLYLFLIGQKLKITPFAYQGKPLLPEYICRLFLGHIDLKEIDSIANLHFILHRHYNQDDYSDFSSTSEDFYSSDLEKRGNDFNQYKDYFKVNEDFNITDTLEISKSDPFGEIFFRMAFEIVCQYLQKCSTYCNYYSIPTYEQFEFDTTSNTIREKSYDDIVDGKDSKDGIYNLHNTLATAILDSHLYSCEYCGKPFIARRTDAKTCGYTCRNAMSLKKRHYKEFLEEHSQPHAEV